MEQNINPTEVVRLLDNMQNMHGISSTLRLEEVLRSYIIFSAPTITSAKRISLSYGQNILAAIRERYPQIISIKIKPISMQKINKVPQHAQLTLSLAA